MAQLFGKDNPAYRGGVTKLRTLIRNSKPYREWKELIFQKHGYKCAHCGMRGDSRTLEAHHHLADFADILQDFLKRFSQYELPKDQDRLLLLSQAFVPFWTIKNGLCLCKNCHLAEHARLKALQENTNDTVQGSQKTDKTDWK